MAGVRVLVRALVVRVAGVRVLVRALVVRVVGVRVLAPVPEAAGVAEPGEPHLQGCRAGSRSFRVAPLHIWAVGHVFKISRRSLS